MRMMISCTPFETALLLKKYGNREVADTEIESTRGGPLEGEWTYLNTDGAIRGTQGLQLLQDKNGEWILGYNKYLGNCSILDTILWGIFDCLKLIHRRGEVNVVIQSDSLEAVKAIRGSVLKSSHSALIKKIQRILSQESNWILRYSPREQNQSVEFIAKLAFGGIPSTN
ncbi:uncharacterized protein [Gossypium hirsutum]|uniref:RNase H type-1 domain-containing protein n=1 Tax=Gossypium hirsutum TaxID=3635 RepID=A0A1U8PNV8_GOSHI|nr:uncharacterized protein LOC107961115 [Gossypium hirsutum]